ncbi:hypothetical protein J2Z22_003397 [Paenibacillus forsythiae]|uniref:Uncharacterized protein n=1 Tax=Paenibacillus forsythiae TaxID=365616 RepID=A0ABU3HAM8_9BACL|nr:hypothetical protein [Paenibacillus forsythiae]MDT3427821.1 hypothetical protein [Paenibacillus forsythiae]
MGPPGEAAVPSGPGGGRRPDAGERSAVKRVPPSAIAEGTTSGYPH